MRKALGGAGCDSSVGGALTVPSFDAAGFKMLYLVVMRA